MFGENDIFKDNPGILSTPGWLYTNQTHISIYTYIHMYVYAHTHIHRLCEPSVKYTVSPKQHDSIDELALFSELDCAGGLES